MASEARTRAEREARAARDDGDPEDTVWRSSGNRRRHYHELEDCGNFPKEAVALSRQQARDAGMCPCKLCVFGDGQTSYQPPEGEDRCTAENRHGERCGMPASLGDKCPKHVDFQALAGVEDGD